MNTLNNKTFLCDSSLFGKSLFFILAFLMSVNLAYSQMGGGGGNIGGSSRIKEDIKFMPIPYINYDRSIGFTIGAVPMVMFNPVKADTLSPSSTAGLFGMYSSNDSWFFMGFGSLFFDEDNWRISPYLGTGTINFQFYLNSPVSSWIPYRTKVDFGGLDVKRRVLGKLYAGIGYNYLHFDTSTEVFQENQTLHGLGFTLSLDKRGNYYYPTDGFYTDIEYDTYPTWFGNEVPSDKIQISYNHFFAFRNSYDVLGVRFFSGLGIGDLNFNQQFIVGGTDIRGYSQGAFRGNYIFAIQGEYRYNFQPRMGAVGFFGLATLFEALNEEDNGKILPGIGTGFRYTFSKETQFNAGFDIAAGLDDWGIYFRLGEAF